MQITREAVDLQILNTWTLVSPISLAWALTDITAGLKNGCLRNCALHNLPATCYAKSYLCQHI